MRAASRLRPKKTWVCESEKLEKSDLFRFIISTILVFNNTSSITYEVS